MPNDFLGTARLVLVRAAGASLVALGLGMDVGAGFMILGGDVATGLATHIPAVMVWGLGAQLVGRDPIVAGTIALVTFPGVGSAGLTLAGVIWPLLTLHNRRTEEAQLKPRIDVERTVQEVPPVNQLRELEVQPLVDALRDGDPVLKRGAIDFLGRQPRADAVRLVRKLLTDPDLEVRSEAGVMLSRLENDMTRSIFAASDAVEKDFQDAAAQAQLGRLLREYAESGLAERVLRRHNLVRARKALLQALEQDKDSVAAADRWLELARVHVHLGQLREARAALDGALAINKHQFDEVEAAQLLGEIVAADTESPPLADPEKVADIALQVALAERNWAGMREIGWPPVDETEGEPEVGVPQRTAPALAGVGSHGR